MSSPTRPPHPSREKTSPRPGRSPRPAPWAWLASVGLHALLLFISPCTAENSVVTMERVELVLMRDDANVDLSTVYDDATLDDGGPDEGQDAPRRGSSSAEDTARSASASARHAAEGSGMAAESSEESEPLADVARPDANTAGRQANEDTEVVASATEDPVTIEEDSPRQAYIHAPRSQEDSSPDGDAPISDRDRDSERESATAVSAIRESAYTEASRAGAASIASSGSSQTRRQEEMHDATDTRARATNMGAEDASSKSTAETTTPDEGRPPSMTDGQAQTGEPTQGIDVEEEDSLADATRGVAPSWMQGLPSEPSSSDQDAVISATPEWWRAGAQRPVQPAGAEQTSSAREAQSARQGQLTETPRPSKLAEIETPEEAVDTARPPQTPGETSASEEQAPLAAPDDGTAEQTAQTATPMTSVFRQDMGWQSTMSAGTDLVSAEEASEQVVLPDSEPSSTVSVRSRKTPEGVYAAHVERTLAANWFDADLHPNRRLSTTRQEVTVLFRVRRNGRVHDLVLTRSSGDAHIDHLALTAVPKRFARFSRDIEARFLLFEWTFHYRE